MAILEDHCEEITDAVNGARVCLALSLSRSIVLIAKVNIRNPLVKLKNFVKGAFSVNLTKFVHIEVKHFLNFDFVLLILKFEQLLAKREFFLLSREWLTWVSGFALSRTLNLKSLLRSLNWDLLCFLSCLNPICPKNLSPLINMVKKGPKVHGLCPIGCIFLNVLLQSLQNGVNDVF